MFSRFWEYLWPEEEELGKKPRKPNAVAIEKLKLPPIQHALTMLICAIQQPAFQEWLDRSAKRYSKSGRLAAQRRTIGAAFPVTFTKSSAGLSYVTLPSTLSFWREFKLYVIDGENTSLMQYEMKFPERVDNHSRISLKFNSEADENLWVCAVLTAVLGIVDSNFSCAVYYNTETRTFTQKSTE